MEYGGTVQKMILDLAEGFSKNDFENPKVEQIQKMISEIQKILYAEHSKEARTDIILSGLSNVFGTIVLEWDMDEYDVNTMGEIFKAVHEANPFKTVMALPKGIEMIDDKEYLKKVYDKIGEMLDEEQITDCRTFLSIVIIILYFIKNELSELI